MGKSRAELIGKVLSNLGLGNDTPSAEDSSKVDRAINDAFASLSARGVYTVANPGSLGPSGGDIGPQEFQQLATVVAAIVAQEFDDADAKYLALSDKAEDELRLIAAPPRTRRHLRIEPALVLRRRHWGY